MSSDDDKVFQPSFYTATLVFTAAVLVLVMVLAGVMAAVPASREHMTVFVPVIAIGGASIVVQALRRIRAVEKVYVYTTTYKEKSNSLLGCPDSYVTDSKQQCSPRTSILTLDESLVSSDKARSGAVVSHTPPTVEMDMTAIRGADKGSFIADTCGDAQYKELVWATHKALCPVMSI